MKTMVMFFFMSVCLVSLTGCATSRYEWSGYDTKLYEHYKDPAQKERFIEALREAVLEGETARRVPPGIYAEYGFVLYEMGNIPQAVYYYQKEADMWPESRSFMTKMIKVAQNRIKKQAAKAAQVVTPESETKQAEVKQPEVAK